MIRSPIAAFPFVLLLVSCEKEQRMPVWSPDGLGLIFVNQASLASRPDLYAIGVDGTSFRPLVTDSVALGCLNPALLRRR